MNNFQTDGLIKILQWEKADIEERLGLRGGKYTDVNIGLTLFMGVCFTGLFYGILFVATMAKNLVNTDGLTGDGVGNTLIDTAFNTCILPAVDMFFHRGITPYVITFFSCWSLAILFIKWRKLKFQKRALTLMVVPQSAAFELTQDTARDILSRMYGLVDDPKYFVLLNRIERALANLRNIGMIADVSAVLRAQAQNDEDHMESSYGLVRGFVWAIPVLGFIGTVLGLSRAIGSFGSVLIQSQGLDHLKTSLQQITSGLAIAFDTTLVALVAALCIQLIMVGLKKKEESFLDECNDYCHANIISKLRLSLPEGL